MVSIRRMSRATRPAWLIRSLMTLRQCCLVLRPGGLRLLRGSRAIGGISDAVCEINDLYGFSLSNRRFVSECCFQAACVAIEHIRSLCPT